MMDPTSAATVAAVGGYLLGSIPFGLVLTHAAGLGDVRHIGSGSIGATNVLRTGNKALAAATLLLDALKGLAAVLLAQWLAAAFMAGATPPLFGALGAVVGHLFPVWLGFKGGKGVATGIGALLGVAWPVAVGICAVWLVVAGIFRRSSLASLSCFAAAPLLALAFATGQVALLALVLAALIVWRHHENISRLIAGTEPRIGEKK